MATGLGARHVASVRNAVGDNGLRQVDRDSTLVITTGRITAQKDPKFFIEVAGLVRERSPQAKFIWVGDGDPEAKRGLEGAGVNVTGWLEPDEVSSLLQRSGVYLHTASFEGFPISILEAAAIGLPIVVRSIPAYDGSPLRGAVTPTGVAELVAECLNGGGMRRELNLLSAQLSAVSTPTKQAEDLQSMYRHLLGGPTCHLSQ